MCIFSQAPDTSASPASSGDIACAQQPGDSIPAKATCNDIVDKNRAEGAKEKFVEVAGAYEILGDERKRRQFDSHGFSMPGGGTDPGGFDFSQAGGDWDNLTPEQQEEIMRQASTMFDEVLEQVEEMLGYDVVASRT